MGRTAVGALKDSVVAVRLSRNMLSRMDRRKGHLTRSEFIRAVLMKELS